MCKKMMANQSLKSQGSNRKKSKIEDLVQKGVARREAQGGVLRVTRGPV